jgi:hypothetical protein
MRDRSIDALLSTNRLRIFAVDRWRVLVSPLPASIAS